MALISKITLLLLLLASCYYCNGSSTSGVDIIVSKAPVAKMLIEDTDALVVIDSENMLTTLFQANDS